MIRNGKACSVDCPHKKECDAQFIASGGKIYARSSRMVHAARFVDFKKDDPRNKMKWPDYCAELSCYFANYKRCHINNSVDTNASCKFCRDESGFGLGVFVEDESADYLFPDFDADDDDTMAEPPVAEIAVPARSASLANEAAIDVRMIAVDDIADSLYQKRVIDEADESFQELVKSIQANGLLQPVVVRADLDDERKTAWELVAGHRRVRAVRAAGLKEIAARVVVMTDAEAEAAVGVENINREDLKPMELAATVTGMLKSGRSVEEIARAFGKSVRWVYRTKSMGKLIPEWDDAAREYQLSQKFLLEIGRLPEAMQKKTWNDVKNGNSEVLEDGGRVADLRSMFLDDDGCNLIEDAKWSGEFPTWCEGCAKRSDMQPDLFADDSLFETPRCLDAQCWEMKSGEYPEALAQKLEASGKKIKRVTGAEFCTSEVVCEKRKGYSQMGVVMDSYNAGLVVWCKSAGEEKEEAEKKPSGPTKKQKRDADFVRMIASIIGAYETAAAVGQSGVSINELSGIAAAVSMSVAGWCPKRNNYQWVSRERAESVRAAWVKMSAQEKADAYWKMVKPDLLMFLRFDTVSNCEEARKRADLVVDWLGIETAEIEESLDRKYGKK